MRNIAIGLNEHPPCGTIVPGTRTVVATIHLMSFWGRVQSILTIPHVHVEVSWAWAQGQLVWWDWPWLASFVVLALIGLSDALSSARKRLIISRWSLWISLSKNRWLGSSLWNRMALVLRQTSCLWIINSLWFLGKTQSNNMEIHFLPAGHVQRIGPSISPCRGTAATAEQNKATRPHTVGVGSFSSEILHGGFNRAPTSVI